LNKVFQRSSPTLFAPTAPRFHVINHPPSTRRHRSRESI